MDGSYEHRDELLVLLNMGKFLIGWATGGFSRMVRLRGVAYNNIRINTLETLIYF
jgi:hypothetical protein